MKKIYLIILILIIGIIVLVVLTDKEPLNQEEQTQPSIDDDKLALSNNTELELPIKRARERVTKKPFGIKISLENSPISPERFSGYHTGIDYEIFEDEKNIDVQVFAICSGKLLRKEKVSGYGGLLVQECELNNQLVTVIYGHIKLSSMRQQTGDYVLLEEPLALLGEAFSNDTDGERKHLHLGIHRGAGIDIRGYVQNESELKNWIDFEEYRK